MRTLVTTLAVIGSLTAQSGYTGLWYRDSDKSDDPEPKLEATIEGFIQKIGGATPSRTSTRDSFSG